MLAAPPSASTSGTASYGLTAFNMGGVVGAILGAFVIMRLGSRLAMLTMAAGAAAGALRAVAHGDWTAGDRLDVRDAGVDRRPDERDADHDVRARRARLSDLDPIHRRRHGGGLRPHRRRSESVGRIVGARHRAAPRCTSACSPAPWWRRSRRWPPSGITFRARRRCAPRVRWSRRRSGTSRAGGAGRAGWAGRREVGTEWPAVQSAMPVSAILPFRPSCPCQPHDSPPSASSASAKRDRRSPAACVAPASIGSSPSTSTPGTPGPGSAQSRRAPPTAGRRWSGRLRSWRGPATSCCRR